VEEEDYSRTCKKFYILGKERNLEERGIREEGIDNRFKEKQVEKSDLQPLFLS
jgi:hypothetical protein